MKKGSKLLKTNENEEISIFENLFNIII